MRRFGLLLLVLAAAAGFATPSHAYLTPGKTSGTEFVLNNLGPNLWSLTIESDTETPGGQFGITNGVGFAPNAAICDPEPAVAPDLPLICASLPGTDLGTGDPAIDAALYFIIAQQASGIAGVGSPRTMGQVQSNGTPAFTIYGTSVLTGIPPDDAGFVAPVSFVVAGVPEPAAIAFLGLGFASLAFLRRRAA
jgi:hypothetical protein